MERQSQPYKKEPEISSRRDSEEAKSNKAIEKLRIFGGLIKNGY